MFTSPSLMHSLALASVGIAMALGRGASSRTPSSAPPDDTSSWAAGVPQSLADERAARVSDLRYQLRFRIPAELTARITGHVTVEFALSDPAAPLLLDFEPGDEPVVSAMVVNGRPQAAARLVNGHLWLAPEALRSGPNRVELEFLAGDTPLNRHDDFLYTIFVPARAHEVFPVFDQPDLKARWTLELEVPDGWVTLGNGAEIARRTTGSRTLVRFAETAPISSYLLAFAAGRFSIEQATRHGRTFRILHRETDAQKVARNRDAIFDLHAAALDWMENYTGIGYPFGKFDVLLVPAFQFGGMEHPGALFYNSGALMLDESATQNQLLERASTIAHETAHMWFGDLVTMRWFTDVWMKEVFANFMAAKIVNPSFPGIDHELRFLHAYYPAAYGVDRTAGTNAIRQPLDNLKDAGTLYGAIIYQKAPIVMRQLESLIGDAAFRDGLRDYLRRYAYRNASWPDLIAILDAATADDLAAWSRAWVEERGRPILRTELAVANGKIDTLTIVQEDPYPTRGLHWTQDVQVAIGDGQSVRLLPLRIRGARTELVAARGLPAPHFVLPNGDGRAYGDINLDATSLTWLAEQTPSLPGGLLRGSAWLTLWDAVLGGQLPAARFIDLALVALPQEPDELNVQRILGYLQNAFWTFTPAEARLTRAAAVERVLRDGLDRATTRSLRSSYFSSLRDIATTPETVDWLMRVWRRDVAVDGLPLAENDFIVLAEELAVRRPDRWKEIVDAQIARTTNPDRKARLQFVTPALSADLAERDRFFASLSVVDNRRREPWVLDALTYLHHPLRAAQSERYIRPSLDLLRDIQQTGDIFFPTRWTNATLGGHRSASAAAIVRGFLRDAALDYPERLRRIILVAADDLFRTSQTAP